MSEGLLDPLEGLSPFLRRWAQQLAAREGMPMGAAVALLSQVLHSAPGSLHDLPAHVGHYVRRAMGPQAAWVLVYAQHMGAPVFCCGEPEPEDAPGVAELLRNIAQDIEGGVTHPVPPPH